MLHILWQIHMSGETPAKHVDLKSELSFDIVKKHTGSGRQTLASTPHKRHKYKCLCLFQYFFNTGFQSRIHNIRMQVDSNLNVVQWKFHKFTQKIPWQLSECTQGNKVSKQSNLSCDHFTVNTCAVSFPEDLFLQFCNDSVPGAWLLQFIWQDTRTYVGTF